RLESIEAPKIILVGNSNLSFGIDSEMIEDELDMSVVNLGLHGGLGNAYNEQIAKLNICDGDIVVVCHSDYSDEDNIEDAELAWITYDFNNQLLPIIRTKDYWNFFKAYPTYCRKATVLWLTHKGNKDSGDCYSRCAFNQYGDVIYKPKDGQMDVDEFFKTIPITVPEINDTCINRLNELNKYCIERGAKMVVAGYPIAYGKYAGFSSDDFISFKNRLASKLECDVISDYTDYFFPYAYFYNSILHLNEDGTQARTNQLIKDLKKWKEEKN
ncbi:MAG: hypothetical protein PHR61_05395, partial [Candidatus Absconditabacteria bacterium]|nr:hypothetical protein [Candidatus Absconditabacteria bacterium]